jgi:hypothetical protein
MMLASFCASGSLFLRSPFCCLKIVVVLYSNLISENDDVV